MATLAVTQEVAASHGPEHATTLAPGEAAVLTAGMSRRRCMGRIRWIRQDVAPARWSPRRMARAMTVSPGPTAGQLGKTLASAT